MPTEVIAPDGAVIEFPDGMSEEEMLAAMRREYGAPSSGYTAERERLERFYETHPGLGPSFASQATAPLNDELAWLAAYGTRGLANLGRRAVGAPVEVTAADAARAAQDVEYERQKQYERDRPLASATGQVLGGFATGPARVGGALAGLRNLGAVAGTGAAYGAAETPGDLTDRAKGAGIGAAASVAALGALRGIGSVVAPRIQPLARQLRDARVRLTPGQALGGAAKVVEDKATSIPILGDMIRRDRNVSLDDFQRALVERPLRELGKRLPANIDSGNDAVAFAQGVVSDAYGKVIPKLSLAPSKRMAVEMRRLNKMVATLPASAQRQIRNVLSEIKFDPNRGLNGEAVKRAESELGRLGSSYGSSAVASERELARVFKEAQSALRREMVRQNPHAAEELKAVNAAFSELATVEDAAGRNMSGMVSPAQYAQAVRRADRSVRKRATAAGNAKGQDFARAGVEVIPSKYADSGTAGRLALLNPVAWAVGMPGAAAYQAAKAVTRVPQTQIAQGVGNLIRTVPSGVPAAAANNQASPRAVSFKVRGREIDQLPDGTWVYLDTGEVIK